MSGTSYGTVVLHVVPEAAAGGPLAARAHRRHRRRSTCPPLALDWRSTTTSSRARRAEWQPPVVPGSDRGWTRLYIEHVTQADEGLDLDFLQGRSGAAVGPQAF